jgi:nucleotide-binding universal stress UspA family protein
MASLLAERFHASVDALYASSARGATWSSAPERVKQLTEEQHAQQRLTGFVASMTRRVCVSSFVTSGTASSVILSHSERHASDLIVMASAPHRRFASARSTITPVSALAACAVLTVGGRFQVAPPRRILLPVGPAGAEPHARSWVTALASRFDAEVGLLRVDHRGGFWNDRATGANRPADAEVLAVLCRAGIDAYEIAHPGGSDSEAMAGMCEAGAFDAIVFGLPAAGEGTDVGDATVAALRAKTGVPVLSVRSPALFRAQARPENQAYVLSA